MHWFWLGGLLIFIAQGWYGYEDWRTHDTVEGVTFLGYLLLFAVPVIQYLLAELLAPSNGLASREAGMRSYFEAHLWLLYLLIAILMIATTVEALVFEPEPAYPCENGVRFAVGMAFGGMAIAVRQSAMGIISALVVGGTLAIAGTLARIGFDPWTRALLGYQAGVSH